jgi:hypothetical protein
MKITLVYIYNDVDYRSVSVHLCKHLNINSRKFNRIIIGIHQTDAQLAGSDSLNCKQSREVQNQTSSKPRVNAKAMFSVERESANVIEWI